MPLVRPPAQEGGRPAAAARSRSSARRSSSSRCSSGSASTTEWRLDPTVHPFATARDQDIRMTTRYFEDNLDGLFATMHECGHGLYEHQVDRALERTPLARGASLGLHESQSRMWENLVGRSLPFWRFFFPQLQELFPEALAGCDAEAWYREVNSVRRR